VQRLQWKYSYLPPHGGGGGFLGGKKIRKQFHLPEKEDNVDCSNYHGISLLSTSYKILSNIHLSRLSLCIDEIIGDHQVGFRCSRSTTDEIFFVHQIMEKNESTMRQYFSYSVFSIAIPWFADRSWPETGSI
jgi:hypothetical protein